MQNFGQIIIFQFNFYPGLIRGNQKLYEWSISGVKSVDAAQSRAKFKKLWAPKYMEVFGADGALG